MLNSTKRLAVAGVAAIGGALVAGARSLGSVVMPDTRPTTFYDENGMPRHKRQPHISRKGYSVAQGKRMARKARNVRRNRSAHK